MNLFSLEYVARSRTLELIHEARLARPAVWSRAWLVSGAKS